LANDGAKIIFDIGLPKDVPGIADLGRRRDELRGILARIDWKDTKYLGREAKIGEGRVIVGDAKGGLFEGRVLEHLLDANGIGGESLVEAGLRFVRRKYAEGFVYFVANRSEKPVDKFVTLQRPVRSAAIFDPRSDSRVGVAQSYYGGEGPFEGLVHIQLAPGESSIVRIYTNRTVKGPLWAYVTNAGPIQQITGTWKVDFVEGEPNVSKTIEVAELKTWTGSDLPELKSFAGTGRYTITFERPEGKADDWMLDLGKVCESARVKLNGHQLGALWCAPFRQTVGEWVKPGKNTLEIEVTNLAANRIADLDRRKVKWKYFYDINVASKRYRSLDASDWPLFDSGLLGPVTLTPLKKAGAN
jgi:hypothetical protein